MVSCCNQIGQWSSVDVQAINLPAAPKGNALIPILERCAVDAVMQAARLEHARLPPLRLGVSVPRMRFFFSPARLHRIMRVIHTAVPGKAACLYQAKLFLCSAGVMLMVCGL